MVDTRRLSTEILQGAAEYFPALIADIDRAVRTIYLESYLIHDDEPTRSVLKALIRARERGVAVFILLDGFGAAGQLGWLKNLLQFSGITLGLYRPGVRWLAPKTWRRLHRKLALIDERVGYVGGINLIGDFYDLKHGLLDQPRLDFAVRVTAERVVARISWAMRRLWIRVSLREALGGSWRAITDAGQTESEPSSARESWRRIRRHLRWRAHPTRLDASRKVRLLLRDNLRFRRSIERWYHTQIDAAQTDVLIANAYFVPTLRFRLCLLRAVARGVRVRLLLQGNSDQWWTQWATQALVRELIEGGVEIFQYQPSFLHAKVAVIDDAVTVGSSNIDPFSLMMSLEANLVCVDESFARQVRAKLDQAIGHSIAQRPAQRTKAWAFRGIWSRLPLTFALMALRVFLTFSRTRFRVQ